MQSTGQVDGLLNAFGGVTVLPDGPGASQMRLDNKSVRSHVGAVATADADGFINPDSLIAHVAPEQGFPPGGLLLRASGS